MQTSDRTHELIRQLSAELQPVRARALAKQLLAGLALGIVVALLSLVLSVGVRPDLSTAMLTSAFWNKWLYVASLSVVALACCFRLARPDHALGKLPLLFAAPVVLLAWRALYELQQADTVARLWLGHSALMCPWNIAALAIPVFVAMLWTMRRLAPTRLVLAGFAAGAVSGASGAMVYALYCNESAAPFVLSWYSLGVLIPALFGALIGPRVLRW